MLLTLERCLLNKYSLEIQKKKSTIVLKLKNEEEKNPCCYLTYISLKYISKKF